MRSLGPHGGAPAPGTGPPPASRAHVALPGEHRLRALLLPGLLLAAAATACGDRAAGSDTDTWTAVRDTVGDTVIVRTLAGSVWGAPATLAEELTIGTLEGRDEEMFGQVQTLAADREGGVYVFDGQVPALRHFGADGEYLRTLGGAGSGPGEYEDVALGIGVRRSDRHVVLRDPRNGRLNVYAPDGEPSDHWTVSSALFTSNAMSLDTADHVYLKILLGRPERNRPWPIGLLHLDADGEIVDTIPPPSIAGEPTTAGGIFSPGKVWDLSPFRDMVVGVTDAYSFEIRRPDGVVVRVEREHEPVRVHPDEKAEWEARNDWMRRTQGQFMTSEIPPVPDVKPAYRSLRVGEYGRVWVQRHTAAERSGTDAETDAPSGGEPDPDRPPPTTWSEPLVYDVFESDGTYLGEVRAPPRTTLHVFRGDTVWGIRLGELDEQYVVRFRVDRSGGEGSAP